MSDLRFKHPFCMMLSGPTGSGKTQLVFDWLNDFIHTIDIPKRVLRVLYSYGVWQKQYEENVHPDLHIKFHEGFCYDYADEKPDLVVVDDLMEELSKDKNVTAVFTKQSHHKEISIIFITQNLFFQSKEMRTISLNCHYITLLKNPRDRLQVMMLGRQIYPNNSTFFNQAYEEAISEPFSHLIIDMTSSCPESLRLRQRKQIKGEKGFIVYQQR